MVQNIMEGVLFCLEKDKKMKVHEEIFSSQERIKDLCNSSIVHNSKTKRFSFLINNEENYSQSLSHPFLENNESCRIVEYAPEIFSVIRQLEGLMFKDFERSI
jgi:hypothetical protein